MVKEYPLITRSKCVLGLLAQCYKVGKLKVTFSHDKTIKYVKKKAYHQMLYLLVPMCDVLLYL